MEFIESAARLDNMAKQSYVARKPSNNTYSTASVNAREKAQKEKGVIDLTKTIAAHINLVEAQEPNKASGDASRDHRHDTTRKTQKPKNSAPTTIDIEDEDEQGPKVIRAKLMPSNQQVRGPLRGMHPGF